MEEKLQIREGDSLEILFEGRDTWKLFWRRVESPLILFTGVAAVAVVLGVWMGFTWWKVCLAVGLFYLFEVVLLGTGFYREARRYAAPATLRLDDDGAVLLDENDHVEERIPLDSIQMLQQTPVSTSVDPQRDAAELLPEHADRELTLHTDDGLRTVVRGVSERRAREAVERFEQKVETLV